MQITKIQRLSQRIISIVADIKTGDIMNVNVALWGIIYLGMAVFLGTKNVLLAFIFLLVSPIFIVAITVITKLGLEKILEILQAENLEKEIIVTFPENGKFEYQDNNMYHVARIEIFNNTETEITNCYATLQLADDISGKGTKIPLIPSLGNLHKPDRVRWNEIKDMNERCEIKIPIQDSRHIDLADGLGTFHYNLCENNLDTNWISVLHTFKLRIDYFNGKAFKFKNIEGYIYSAYLGDLKEVFVKNGRIKKQTEIQQDQITHQKMIFKEGDWKQDEEVRGYMEMRN